MFDQTHYTITFVIDLFVDSHDFRLIMQAAPWCVQTCNPKATSSLCLNEAHQISGKLKFHDFKQLRVVLSYKQSHKSIVWHISCSYLCSRAQRKMGEVQSCLACDSKRAAGAHQSQRIDANRPEVLRGYVTSSSYFCVGIAMLHNTQGSRSNHHRFTDDLICFGAHQSLCDRRKKS